MSRRRKTLLVAVALVLLAAGGFAWYWQATSVDRRVNAILAEGRAGEPGLVEGWFIKLGMRKERQVRAWDEVADDLAKLGPSAVPAFIEALDHENEDVRGRAISALGEFRDERAIHALGKVLCCAPGEGIWKSEERAYAVSALGGLGPAAVPILLGVLELDHYESVEFDVVRELMAMGRSGVDGLGNLLSSSDSRVRRRACAALGKVQGWRAGEFLGKALSDHDASVRASAAFHMRYLRSDEFPHALMDALASEDPRVRIAATASLGILGSPRAIRALTSRFEAGELDMVPTALAKIGTAESVGALFDAIRARRVEPEDLVGAMVLHRVSAELLTKA
ncbi:hypothetical protein LCGC14_1695200, partial [marine sediment metagenome]